eukprot:RCo005145
MKLHETPQRAFFLSTDNCQSISRSPFFSKTSLASRMPYYAPLWTPSAQPEGLSPSFWNQLCTLFLFSGWILHFVFCFICRSSPPTESTMLCEISVLSQNAKRLVGLHGAVFICVFPFLTHCCGDPRHERHSFNVPQVDVLTYHAHRSALLIFMLNTASLPTHTFVPLYPPIPFRFHVLALFSLRQPSVMASANTFCRAVRGFLPNVVGARLHFSNYIVLPLPGNPGNTLEATHSPKLTTCFTLFSFLS